MNADAEFDALVGRDLGVALDHRPLDFDGAVHRIDDAAEFNDAAVAGAFDDAPVVGGDCRIHEIAAETAQARECAILVRASESAVTDDIRDQDRRELSGFAHCVPPAVGRLAQMPARVRPKAGSF
jgi:hypothetical protein